MATNDIFIYTWSSLREAVVNKKNLLTADEQRLVDSPHSASAEVLTRIFLSTMDPDIEKFSKALYFCRFLNTPSEENVIPQSIEIISWLINEFPGMQQSIKDSYDSGMASYISHLKNYKMILPISSVLKAIETLGIQIKLSKIALQNKAVIIIYNLVAEIKERLDLENIKLVSIIIEALGGIGINLELAGNLIFGRICDFLIEKNDVYRIQNSLNKQSFEDLDEIFNILAEIKRIKPLQRLNLVKLKALEDKLGRTVNISTISEIDDSENLIKAQSKERKIVPAAIWRTEPEYFRKIEELIIKVYIGELSNGNLVAKKSYINPSALEIKTITKEIEVLTTISAISTTENCFLHFFGPKHIPNQIDLYMEAHNITLMKHITEMSKKNLQFDRTLTESWICKLVNAFAHLHSMNIFHRDIKPHNILVTKDMNLKIIDFGVADTVMEKDYDLMPTGEFLIQGTQGYMAPELESLHSKSSKIGNFRPEKTDVFSLGLTIYQMITFNQTTSLNIKEHGKQERLNKLVHELNVSEWVKSLLYNMLVVEYADRITLKECLRYIPGSNESYAATVVN